MVNGAANNDLGNDWKKKKTITEMSVDIDSSRESSIDDNIL